MELEKIIIIGNTYDCPLCLLTVTVYRYINMYCVCRNARYRGVILLHTIIDERYIIMDRVYYIAVSNFSK